MKRSLIFLLFMAVAVTGFSQHEKTQNVKVGPLGFLFGNYNLRYEKAFAARKSFQVGANFYSYKLFDVTSTGFGVDGEYRYYFRSTAPKGGYVAPGVGFDFNKTSVSTTDDTKVSYSLLKAGANIGYQWIAGGGFVVDLGVGIGYRVELSKDDLLSNSYSGIYPRFNFALGYAF